MPVIRLLSFATVMLAAVSVAAPLQSENDIARYMSNVNSLMASARVSRDYKQASIEIDAITAGLQTKHASSTAANLILAEKVKALKGDHEATNIQLGELRAEKNLLQKQLDEISANLKAKQSTEATRNEADQVALDLKETISRLEEKEAAAKGLEKLLFLEVALKEQSETDVKALDQKIKQIQSEIAEGIKLNKSYQDAVTQAEVSKQELQNQEVQLNLIKDDHELALARLAEEMKQQAQECDDEAKVKLAGVQATILLTTEQNQKAIQVKQNLRNKVDLWKSMTNFLQKDLENTKSVTEQMKIIYAAETGKQTKKQQKEKKNTEEQLSSLKEQIETIKTRATANKKAADEMVEEQQIATKSAKQEVARLQKQLTSLKNLHKLTKSKMTLAQKQTMKDQQTVARAIKGKVMTLIEGLKIQRAKANQAAGKVQVLSSALEKLKKASKQIELQKITVPQSIVNSSTNLEVAPLPSLSLTGSNQQIYNSQRNLNSLALKEQAELDNISARFDMAKAAIVSTFQSESAVEAMRQTASVKIAAERQRIIKFRKQVTKRYLQYKQSFNSGKLSEVQMKKVQAWAMKRMAYARDKYADLAKKTSGSLDESLKENESIKSKLNELLMKTKAEKTAVKQKFDMLRTVKP